MIQFRKQMDFVASIPVGTLTRLRWLPLEVLFARAGHSPWTEFNQFMGQRKISVACGWDSGITPDALNATHHPDWVEITRAS